MNCPCEHHLRLVAPSDLLSCGRHEDTCTRAKVEHVLGCYFTRYICERYVVLHLEPALDAPFEEAAFDSRTGKYVAGREYGGLTLTHGLPDGGETTCDCHGPPTFKFPDLDECTRNVVMCESVEQPRWTDHQ